MYYYKRIHLGHLDPILAVTLRSQNSQEIISLFLQLFGIFEQTFFTTTSLRLWIKYPRSEADSDGMEVFLPLINSFPSFDNLSTLYLSSDFHSFLLPLLQRISSSGSVLLPSLRIVRFINADFRPSSESLAPVSAFLQWRRERGFPIHKINIIECCIDQEYVQLRLRDVEVDMEDCWSYYDSDPDTEYY